MFGKRITLFKLLGFEVRADASWFVIAALVSWSLATGFFPGRLPRLSGWTYWGMGIAGALGLFASIVFHEMSHALVARKYGLRIKGITLYIFGGVAEMEEEPPSPRVEFFIALAGPLSSVVLSLACYVLLTLGRDTWPPPVAGVVSYLAVINGLLAAFNLVPAFPLDGGRVLRAILWRLKGNIRWATRIASTSGSAFGAFLIVLGIFAVFRGNFIGGMWWFLIGMFLRGSSQASYQQLLVRKALEGERVSRFMKADPLAVGPFLSLNDFVEAYVYKYHFKMFPVVSDSRLLGSASTRNSRRFHARNGTVPACSESSGRVRPIMPSLLKTMPWTPLPP